MIKKEYFIIASSLLIGFFIMVIFKIPCPIKFIFDIDCAGCGTTRMLAAICRLDLYQAFRYNPFIFILMIIGFCYCVYVFICKLFKKKYIVIGKKTFIFSMILIILFMIIRNINGFEFLKPTVVK